MCRLTLLLATSLLLSLSSAFAQDSAARDRVEAGVFFDYLGISQTTTNNFGLGARFAYRVHPDVMLEGEFAYDYGLNFDEAYRNIANGNVAAIDHTAVGVTQGLIGPNIQRSSGHLHPYVTIKGGFIDFRLSPSLLPYSNVASSILGLRTSNLNAALYPAAGHAAAVTAPVPSRRSTTATSDSAGAVSR